MTFETLHAFAAMVKTITRNFCGGQYPTLDEVESLVWVIIAKAEHSFLSGRKIDTDGLERIIRNTVENEILKTCV